jgi:drug/metabolite transporter (DMT)-like permease
MMHALWNYLAKSARDSRAFMWCLVATSSAFLIPVSIALFFAGYPLPRQAIVLAVLSGFVQAMYFVSLGRAYRKGDLSIVYPLSRSVSLVLLPMIAYLFLKERLSGLGFAGIGAVLMGIYVLQMQELSLKSLGKPILALGQRPQLWAIATGLCTTAYSALDKAGMVTGLHPLVYYNGTTLVILLALAPVAFIRRAAIREEWGRGWRRIVVAGLLMPASYGLALYIMRTNAASYVLAVRQVSVVLGVVIGSLVLREPYGGIRLIGGMFIFIGVALIGLAR